MVDGPYVGKCMLSNLSETMRIMQKREQYYQKERQRISKERETETHL